MSSAVLLAAAAGSCGAVAAIDLLRSTRRRCRATRHSNHLAAMAVLLARLGRRAGMRAAPGDLEARVKAAGVPLGLGAGDVVALKGAGALGALLLALPVASALPSRLAVVTMLAAPAAGYHLPEHALARRARARGQRIAHELADTVDLLRVAVAAGLPVGRAMGEVGRRMRGVLAVELGAAAARIQLGAPRSEALRELVARCPADGVAVLAAAIARADRHGTALAPALEALAADARADQARRLRDSAARAAPKIQLVVALVLVPAVMLLVAAVLVRGLDG